ncbi:hypothetical protein BJ138DRAFT_978896, partial [Hygrophoropsis aurantiaca]
GTWPSWIFSGISTNAFAPSSTLSEEDKLQLREEIQKNLDCLHQQGFVHGDVRDTNVMVSHGLRKWMLTDFDRSGKMGEVQYPTNVYHGEYLR